MKVSNIYICLPKLLKELFNKAKAQRINIVPITHLHLDQLFSIISKKYNDNKICMKYGPYTILPHVLNVLCM